MDSKKGRHSGFSTIRWFSPSTILQGRLKRLVSSSYLALQGTTPTIVASLPTPSHSGSCNVRFPSWLCSRPIVASVDVPGP